MGFFSAIIVAVVGIVLALLINWLPVDILLKIVPICWIPSVNCSKWYNNIKIYLIIILLAIIMFFIPIP
ncbi:putative membrane protein [Saudi moumouvirus]|uniref:Uncharacterized protein n=1 Tax=Moumouvirus sp. 'Monve' TaxID=1128131 RepID=H2EDT5_9VIRU|nr:hypothetical protein mv_L353 [Moumouvirus Monve]AQN68497.1 putative membrane protein [Saudi moumouvirus]